LPHVSCSKASGGQQHSSISARAKRGFSVLWEQVLVSSKGQELAPIAEYEKEHGIIAESTFYATLCI